jgi:16S rRNA G966 N2-methylase RsmD
VLDSLAAYVPGALVLDVCAGSGAQGIETLSLGADHVVFVDLSPAALKLARENVELCSREGLDRTELKRMAADRYLEDLALGAHVEDERDLILFVSPPYESSREICEAACRAFPAIALPRASATFLVLQHPPRLQFELPDPTAAATIERRTYLAGDSQATIFRMEPGSEPEEHRGAGEEEDGLQVES